MMDTEAKTQDAFHEEQRSGPKLSTRSDADTNPFGHHDEIELDSDGSLSDSDEVVAASSATDQSTTLYHHTAKLARRRMEDAVRWFTRPWRRLFDLSRSQNCSHP